MPLAEGQSPYLRDSQRLSDVIAAIQAMGTYKFYKRSFEGWSDRISGDESRAVHWRQVFEEHPEFFRLDGERKRASLVWRRQYPKRFHVDQDRQLTIGEYNGLSQSEKARVSRNPLTAPDIQALIRTAIDLHSRALERAQDKRWWIPLVFSGVGGLIGSIVGVFIKGK